MLGKPPLLTYPGDLCMVCNLMESKNIQFVCYNCWNMALLHLVPGGKNICHNFLAPPQGHYYVFVRAALTNGTGFPGVDLTGWLLIPE